MTDANESMADTSSGSSVPPMPARSVASTSRSGPLGQRRERPGEVEREALEVGRLVALGQLHHQVLEGQQHPRVDLEGEVQVERAAAGLLGVQVDLPRLAQRVRLDEVAFVVHVEPVVDGVVLQLGDEPGDVDDRHSAAPFTSQPEGSLYGYRRRGVTGGPDPDELPGILSATAAAIVEALARRRSTGASPDTIPGQHHSDLAADAAAVEVLVAAGVGVLSEESGRHHPERAVTVVVDPLDGSTNASRGIPWFATSLCAVDADGPVAALVVDLVHGTRYEAVRGGGARRDGEPITPSTVTRIADAIVGVNGLPDHHLGWAQFRALGAAALDLCAVADGRLDGYVECTADGLAPWDYLGGLLVCREAGHGARAQRPRARGDRPRRPSPRRRRRHRRPHRRPDRGEGRLGTVVKRP